MTPPATKYLFGTGKRKTAIARVRLYLNGSGTITVNNKPLVEYFPVESYRREIKAPLALLEQQKAYDITVKVIGGGPHAQAQAVRHGIARSLLQLDDLGVRGTLKQAGFITRDSRIKERKKFGLKRARRAPQFSKR